MSLTFVFESKFKLSKQEAIDVSNIFEKEIFPIFKDQILPFNKKWKVIVKDTCLVVIFEGVCPLNEESFAYLVREFQVNFERFNLDLWYIPGGSEYEKINGDKIFDYRKMKQDRTKNQILLDFCKTGKDEVPNEMLCVSTKMIMDTPYCDKNTTERCDYKFVNIHQIETSSVIQNNTTIVTMQVEQDTIHEERIKRFVRNKITEKDIYQTYKVDPSSENAAFIALARARLSGNKNDEAFLLIRGLVKAEGATGLHWAVKAKSKEHIKDWILDGASTETRDMYDKTPLDYADSDIRTYIMELRNKYEKPKTLPVKTHLANVPPKQERRLSF